MSHILVMYHLLLPCTRFLGGGTAAAAAASAAVVAARSAAAVHSTTAVVAAARMLRRWPTTADAAMLPSMSRCHAAATCNIVRAILHVLVRLILVACCKSNDETTKARRCRFLKQSEERKTYPLPGTKEKPGRRR